MPGFPEEPQSVARLLLNRFLHQDWDPGCLTPRSGEVSRSCVCSLSIPGLQQLCPTQQQDSKVSLLEDSTAGPPLPLQGKTSELHPVVPPGGVSDTGKKGIGI